MTKKEIKLIYKFRRYLWKKRIEAEKTNGKKNEEKLKWLGNASDFFDKTISSLENSER